MSGTEEVTPPAPRVGDEEEAAADMDAAGDNGKALSSKSSDISIEEIGPEDSGVGGVDDNAEVLIAEEVVGEVAAAAPGAAVEDIKPEAAEEEKPKESEEGKGNSGSKEATPPKEGGDELPPPPPPTAQSSSAALAPQGMPSLSEILDETDDVELEDDDDDDFEDETLMERLVGLTEMFPEGMTSGTVSLAKGSVSGAKWLYGASRNLTWIVFSTASVLFLPVMIETQLLEIEEAQKQQQRQILLGPGSAMSAGQNAPLPKAPV